MAGKSLLAVSGDAAGDFLALHDVGSFVDGRAP